MPPPQNVELYFRKGCHLCEEASELLDKYAVPYQVVDLDTDAELVKLYSTCVPVVVIDGKVRFRGQINEVLLRRLLKGY